MWTVIGLLMSLSDRRLRYPTGSGRDRPLVDRFGSTVYVTFRTRTVIGLLLSLSDRQFRCPSGGGL